MGGWFIEGPFVFNLVFIRKKSTYLKALLFGRGGPVRMIDCQPILKMWFTF